MLTLADHDRHTALHEAAHAVLFAACEYDVPAIVLRGHLPPEFEGNLGMCLPTGQRIWPHDDILISMAGMVVEYRIRDDLDDEVMMLEAVDLHLFEIEMEETPGVCRCDMCLAVDVARRMHWHADNRDVAWRKQLVRSWAVVTRIVNDSWPVIERIAADLLVRRRLTQDEVARHCSGISVIEPPDDQTD